MSRPTYLTIAEICRLLHCSPTTFWRMRKNTPGFPPPFHIGRRMLWNREQIERALGLIR